MTSEENKKMTTEDAFCRAAEKLAREAARLDRDIGELFKLLPVYSHRVELEAPIAANSKDALSLVSGAIRNIRGAEFHLNSIRSTITCVANDVHSREEFERFLNRG
jgi:hypothetical protein